MTLDAFDGFVIEREMERDLNWGGGPRIVETWHPGNLAYAAARSPRVFARLFPIVREHVSNLEAHVLVQPLVMSRSTALERLSERGPDPESLTFFFSKVAMDSSIIAGLLELHVLYPMATDQLSPDLVCARLLESTRVSQAKVSSLC